MRRLSCVVERRVQTIDANYFMHTTINHPRPCSFDGIGGVGILTTTIRGRVYDRQHITAIDGGEVKCIIPPLRNHSTITKINANTQQSTEPHIPIAAPPFLQCHRHRDDDKHNNMPTIRCIRKHRGGGSTFVSHVQYIISCNGGMVLTATKQASNQTYNNQPLSVCWG